MVKGGSPSLGHAQTSTLNPKPILLGLGSGRGPLCDSGEDRGAYLKRLMLGGDV